MQANNILQADLLDILFENRNKSYGAYALRKTYNKRLLTALGTMVLLCLFISLGSLFAGDRKKVQAPTVIDLEIKTEDLKEDKEKPIEELPAAAAPAPATPALEQVRVEQFVTIEIVPNEEVTPENAVAPVADLDKAQIGKYTTAGGDDSGIAPPVLQGGTGDGKGFVPAGHGNEVVDEGIFVTVQVEARFPGGVEAWRKFLEKNLNRDAPVENGAPEGSKLTVVVSFVVDKEGNVSEVKAENDPGYGTATEAVRIIKRGPKWIPAIQNGRNVIYRQRQSVTFLVAAE